MNKIFYRVTIDISQAQTHRAQVQIEKAGEDLPGILEFPVWTPGSYLVREYARHITRLEPGNKISKNRWEIPQGAKSVSYEVYGFERTVRTTFIDENYAVLIGASLLPLLRGPFEVELLVPAHWKGVSSALPFKSKGKGRFTALVEDDDQWIDCPIVAWAPGFGGSSKFNLKGIPHQVAWVGMECTRSLKELEESFAKIASATINLFGGAPFKDYWFLLHFGHKLYGGLEHRNSQLSQFDGSTLKKAKEWDGFLRLIAHEYLHSWNVKSLRPIALGPFDYSKENYTQDIWFAEGLTDYLDDYLCWKAGLIDEKAYWKSRVKDISLAPDGLPAHFRRSLAESSLDAWIRHYRPDEDSANTDVSYYCKGALLGWCWDAHLQAKSKGKWTLPKLMKKFWQELGIDAYESLSKAKPGYTRKDLVAIAEKATGIPHKTFLEKWVTGRTILPWTMAAKQSNLKIKTTVNDPLSHFGGFQIQWKNTSALVARVYSDSAAEDAEISPNDEILAINGTRITDQEKLSSTFDLARQEGKTMELLLCRLDKIFTREMHWRKHPGLGVEYSL